MAKSSRNLWTQKVVEGEVKSTAKGNVWTFEKLSAVAKRTAGEIKKSDDIRRNLSGTQMRGKVLGIDPSLRGTGLSIIESMPDGTLRYVESLTVKNGSDTTMPQCLARIFKETSEIIRRHRPICAAIEQTVYVQNFKTALILGSSRGAAIAAAASENLEVFDYPPLRIKQAVIGYGRASKEQVARSVAALVAGAGVLPTDESDASGAAIAHIYTRKS